MSFRRVGAVLLLGILVLQTGCPMGDGGLVPLPRTNSNTSNGGANANNGANTNINTNSSPGVDSSANGDNPDFDRNRVGAMLLGRWNIVDPKTNRQVTVVEYTPGETETDFTCTNINEDGTLKIDSTGNPVIPANIVIQPGGTPRDFEILDETFRLRYMFLDGTDDQFNVIFFDDQGNEIPSVRAERR